jgi:hypothetical protein
MCVCLCGSSRLANKPRLEMEHLLMVVYLGPAGGCPARQKYSASAVPYIHAAGPQPLRGA